MFFDYRTGYKSMKWLMLPGAGVFEIVLVKVLTDEQLHASLVEKQHARSKEVNDISKYKATLCELYGIKGE